MHHRRGGRPSNVVSNQIVHRAVDRLLDLARVRLREVFVVLYGVAERGGRYPLGVESRVVGYVPDTLLARRSQTGNWLKVRAVDG